MFKLLLVLIIGLTCLQEGLAGKEDESTRKRRFGTTQISVANPIDEISHAITRISGFIPRPQNLFGTCRHYGDSILELLASLFGCSCECSAPVGEPTIPINIPSAQELKDTFSFFKSQPIDLEPILR